MALTKNNLDISFAQGLDTKTDSKRVTPGKFLALNNSVFQKGGLLSKRNGFGNLPPLPTTDTKTLTTFGGSLTAIGTSLSNYTPENKTWYNKGDTVAVGTVATPLVRSATSQSQQDVAIDSSGLVCSVWADSDGTAKYQINDTHNSQIVVPSVSLGATSGQARVFILGKYFIITYLVTSGGNTLLQFIGVPIQNVFSPTSPATIGLQVNSLTAGYDGYVANNMLYVAWYDVAPAIKIATVNSALLVTSPTVLVGAKADYLSVTADTSTPSPVIWVTYWNSTTNNLSTAIFSSTLALVHAPIILANDANVKAIGTLAADMALTVFYQDSNTYSYAPNHESDFLRTTTCTQAGTIGTPTTFIRSVGLASKPFTYNGTIYMMVAYGVNDARTGGVFQPTYFLSDSEGNLSAKLAYSNAGGYPASQVLPSVYINNNIIQIGYLFKDLLTSVNKNQGVLDVNGIYSQTGVNLVSWTINAKTMSSAEIGNNLHLGGGFVWMYDGAKPVEHNFHLWPEDIAVTTATGSGSIGASTYYYQVVYEWTDAQGNIHRSAPSIPVKQVTTTASSTNTLNIPTLRLTYKTGSNKIRIVIYRWSTAQENYYQITSVTSPLLNDTSIDSVTYIDTQSDAQILGNQLIYTTGGVIENIAYPAADDMTLYKSRLVLIDAEDKNLLWYSKQVIQSTPVEPSDLFTLYVAPTSGAQGSTGVNTALSAMDDKLIIFKRNAIYYLTGTGPDNAGASNDFSDPNYITATVGCDNPQSIVFMPQGLMFQSDKGIWLLGRDLATTYIGAPVEQYNSNRVLSALNIPGTNQVRFTLDNGIVLMYDYYYGQWGTFSGVSAISCILYQDKHTYVNAQGLVRQETPGLYLDGTIPVVMSFTTGWMSLAGLQGFERAYSFYILGTYITPHKLSVQIAHDYNPAITQSVLISPSNFNPAFGNEAGPYGSGDPYGGVTDVEQFRVFFQNQKCQAFQISITESFDPSFGTAAGAGLTLSGLNLVVGAKKGYTTIRSSQSVG